MDDCEVSLDRHRNRYEDRTDSADVAETEPHRKDEDVHRPGVPNLELKLSKNFY